ncbi:MAG: acyl-CoA dehydrogenase [Pirellulaceae bacterium]
MKSSELLRNLTSIADRFAAERAERLGRTELDPNDFVALREAGYLLLGVPAERGGLWTDVAQTVRLVCDALRTLAHGDSSVALVSAMHPAVLSYWLTAPREAAEHPGWNEQCNEIFGGVKQGVWWGTITSEPGSGGDVARTRTTAARDAEPHGYRISGQKHFGSGSGVLDVMVTTAVADGEEKPDWFYLDMRGVPLDDSAGARLIAKWDGHGMAATQSHAVEFTNFPATRIAWEGHLDDVAARTGGFIGCLFTSVIVGVVEVAVETAANRLKPMPNAFEQVEWTRVQLELWLIQQALQGMLRAVETQVDPRIEVLKGKTAIAELAETVLTRLCRVMGGGTFSRRSPFGHWFEDVRALGFLRPPWGLAYDTLIRAATPPGGE